MNVMFSLSDACGLQSVKMLDVKTYEYDMYAADNQEDEPRKENNATDNNIARQAVNASFDMLPMILGRVINLLISSIEMAYRGAPIAIRNAPNSPDYQTHLSSIFKRSE